MKQKLWITLITWLAYCVDKELRKAIDYLKERVPLFMRWTFIAACCSRVMLIVHKKQD